MTQATETTAERIESVIVDAFEFDRFGRVMATNPDVSAKTIAAEINRLTADLRMANAEISRLMPLPEIYTLWKKIIEDGNPSRDTVAHFVELAHEAAERAAAAPADLRTPTDQRIAALEAQMGALRAEVNRALHEQDAAQMSAGQWRAEVERLRPAAEAWEAMEAWRNPSGRTVSGVDMAYKAMVAAAARARAAKGTR